MNQFFDETEHHRKYNSHQHHHNDVNQGFPLLDAHHVLSRDNNNNTNNQRASTSSSLASSAVKEQSSRTITMMSATIPSLGNVPLTEESEMRTDNNNGVNAVHGTTNDDALDENGDRRLRMLEKNRRAAARCRQRKKIWVEELRQHHQEAKRRSDELQGIILNLREEVYSLKNQILAHEGCDCHAVKDYIKVFLMNEVVQKSKFNATSSQGATEPLVITTTVTPSVQRNNSHNV